MIELTLPDMTCGHCAGTVEKTARQIDPAAKVEVDLKTKLVKITSGADRKAFTEALTEAGYPPAA